MNIDVVEIIPISENYELLNAVVKKVSKECIPRGAKKKYTLEMESHLQTLYRNVLKNSTWTPRRRHEQNGR